MGCHSDTSPHWRYVEERREGEKRSLYGVLCTVYGVLCTVYCVLCTVYCVLRAAVCAAVCAVVYAVVLLLPRPKTDVSSLSSSGTRLLELSSIHASGSAVNSGYAKSHNPDRRNTSSTSTAAEDDVAGGGGRGGGGGGELLRLPQLCDSLFDLKIRLSSIGLSLVDRRPQEVAYISVRRIGFNMRLDQSTHTTALNFGELRIDNQLTTSPFTYRPVMLFANKQRHSHRIQILVDRATGLLQEGSNRCSSYVKVREERCV